MDKNHDKCYIGLRSEIKTLTARADALEAEPDPTKRGHCMCCSDFMPEATRKIAALEKDRGFWRDAHDRLHTDRRLELKSALDKVVALEAELAKRMVPPAMLTIECLEALRLARSYIGSLTGKEVSGLKGLAAIPVLFAIDKVLSSPPAKPAEGVRPCELCQGLGVVVDDEEFEWPCSQCPPAPEGGSR